MTYEEFEKGFYNDILPNKESFIRIGQALMNYLANVWLKEYKRISSIHFYDRTNIDCFYTDKLINNTLKHLKRVWKNYPN